MDYFDFLRGMEDQPLLDHRSRGRRLLRQFPPPKKKNTGIAVKPL